MKQTELITRLVEQVTGVFVGKRETAHNALMALFSGLHLLIEDIPGVGKTTLARAIAASCGMDFGRIQFTPDLLPGDIIGMAVWSSEKRELVFKKGPIMHQFVLADEINRATARTQSAMLEAMQEKSVTVEDRTYPLPEPFFVIATQNPLTFSGTFELPEAQLDRFGLCFSIGYPGKREEKEILSRFRAGDPVTGLTPVISGSEILAIRAMVREIHVSEKVMDYMIGISDRSRRDKMIKLGISPRGTQHLLYASQAEAYLQGREYVIPEDVKKCAMLTLCHRIVLSAEARMENHSSQSVVSGLLAQIPIPSGTDNVYGKD